MLDFSLNNFVSFDTRSVLSRLDISTGVISALLLGFTDHGREQHYFWSQLPIHVQRHSSYDNCILGVVSNGLLLLAFFKDPLKCFRNSTTHFVTNLSISDCLTCLFALLTANEMIAENRKIILFLIESFAGVSLVSLTSISIDRFLMVAYPIKHRILMKGKVIVLCLAVIWIFGCSLSGITPLFGRQNKIYIYLQRWCD